MKNYIEKPVYKSNDLDTYDTLNHGQISNTPTEAKKWKSGINTCSILTRELHTVTQFWGMREHSCETAVRKVVFDKKKEVFK